MWRERGRGESICGWVRREATGICEEIDYMRVHSKWLLPFPYLLQHVVIIVLERQTIGIQFHEHHGNCDAEDDLSPAAGGDDGHNGSHQNPANGLNHL